MRGTFSPTARSNEATVGDLVGYTPSDPASPDNTLRVRERLGAALRLKTDPEENRQCVTQLMSALVGALLFARAVDDPVQSNALLEATRRGLREQYCREPVRTSSAPRDAGSGASDFLRAF